MSDNNLDYHKDRIANRTLHPETLMMGYGYAPAWSQGALKPPIFQTSTYVFENAQQGKENGAAFQIAEEDKRLEDNSAGGAENEHDRGFNAGKARGDEQDGGADGQSP